MEMMFSWLKYRRSFISRNVRRQNMEWSNGVIFLMATFWPEGLCSAELSIISSRSDSAFLENHSPDDAICALSHDILDVVLLRHVERDLSRAPAGCSGLARHGEGVREDVSRLLVERRSGVARLGGAKSDVVEKRRKAEATVAGPRST